MPAARADLAVSSRWILPMTSPGAVLEHHTVIVRDGRILDLLPTPDAAARYAATVQVARSAHVLMPGLVNACAEVVPPPGDAARRERLDDAVLLRVAALLASGTTCFCGVGAFPDATARTAAGQGLRAVIGMPIAESAGPWAATPGEYVTRALSLRDEFRGHPTIATAFAPHLPADIGDDTFARIAMLADELDAGIVMSLHESPAEIARSLARHRARPIERMHTLGLLTPALTAAHMVQVNESDIALAQRAGIALACCPESNLRRGHGATPVAAWTATGLRLGVGSGAGDGGGAVGLDLWGELKALALAALAAPAAPGIDALAAATRGGAAALGLDAEIGTLEAGKWADLCCVDLSGPAVRWALTGRVPDPGALLPFHGGRDTVSDVWVSGRQLINDGTFTRLDWQELTARVNSWPGPFIPGDRR
jgi:5-methylthioadenosine/S-adenosylhomocysteine deaminase